MIQSPQRTEGIVLYHIQDNVNYHLRIKNAARENNYNAYFESDPLIAMNR